MTGECTNQIDVRLIGVIEIRANFLELRQYFVMSGHISGQNAPNYTLADFSESGRRIFGLVGEALGCTIFICPSVVWSTYLNFSLLKFLKILQSGFSNSRNAIEQ